ncbi:MAG: hypothetical protein SNJ77_01015 [Cytophagales bacterium]
MTEFHIPERANKDKSLKDWIWTVFFSLMYPFLMLFAILATSAITVSSWLSRLVYWVLKKR